MNAFVEAASFSFPHEAQIAKSSLEAAGIPVFVRDQHTINMNWLYSNALGGVRIMVPPDRLDEARALLAADFSPLVEEEQGTDNSVCPKCGSHSAEPFTRGKRPAFVVFMLLGFPLFFVKHGLKCDDCGHFRED